MFAKFTALGTGAKIFVVSTALVLVGGGVAAAVALQPQVLGDVKLTEDQLKNPQDYSLRYRFTFSVARIQSGPTFKADLTDQDVEVSLSQTAQCRTNSKASACQHYIGKTLPASDPIQEGACDPKVKGSPGANTFEVLWPNGKSSGVTSFAFCVPPKDAAPLRITQDFQGAFEGWGTYALTVSWVEAWAMGWWGSQYNYYKSQADVVDYEYDLKKPSQGWLT